MPSVFAFYRARGIPGAYVVGIQLDLLPTETAYIAHIPYQHDGIRQNPMKTIQEEKGRRELYRIERINIHDAVSIVIYDEQLAPYQNMRYTATLDGFYPNEYPFTLQRGHDRHDYGVIVLNEITMIDLDNEEVVIEQSPRIVEADPVKPIPKKKYRKRKIQVPHDNDLDQSADLEDPAFQF